MNKLEDAVKSEKHIILDGSLVRCANTYEVLGEWFKVGKTKYFMPKYIQN